MAYFSKTSASFASTCEGVIPKPHIRVFPVSEVGLRFYSTRLSRWISRDPTEELDCVNLYMFVKNNPIYSGDVLGLWDFDLSVTPETKTTWTRQWYVEEYYVCSKRDGGYSWVLKPSSGPFTFMFKWLDYKEESRDKISGVSINLAPSTPGNIIIEIISGRLKITTMPPIEIKGYTRYKNTGFYSIVFNPTWKTTFAFPCNCDTRGLEDFLEVKMSLEFHYGDWR